MADAAAFFANKKKKKKTFKFNANKIDASTVTHTVHVDAPALSTDNDATVPTATAMPTNLADTAPTESNDAGEQWDDEAMAATMAQKKAVAANSAAELLDMKALDLQRSEQGDIQEKLRVEETKAKLAAAREGMEKEAQRLKDAKDKKDQDVASTAKPRFGAAAAGLATPGAKWVPVHMRGGGRMSMASRLGGSGAFASQKLDTEDENLFPDLASADAILEKQKQQGPAYKVPKKTPVGGGATWGSKLKSKQAKPDSPETQPEPEQQADAAKPDEPASADPSVPPPSAEPTPAPKAPEPAAAPKQPIKPKKKKKKDLSTFKPT